MPERRLITGLDVGTSKVCAIIAEAHPSGQLDVLGFGASPSHGLRKGMVVDLERTSEAIGEAVAQAERMAGAEVHQVFLGIAGGHIASLNSHGVVAVSRPDWEITQSDVGRAVEAARAVALPGDRQVIHVLPREFVVDGCRGIRDPVGMSGVRLEVYVHIVTGAVTALRNMVKCVERTGLQVADMILQPLASAEAVLAPEERYGSCVLVDIGAGTTDVAVFHEGSIWHTAVLAVGGNHVTSDLSYGLRLPWAEAERLKINHGRPPVLPGLEAAGQAAAAAYPGSGSGPAAWLAGAAEGSPGTLDPAFIIRARLEEILQLVADEVKRVPHPTFVPAGAVVTGGSSQLGGLLEVGRRVLGLPMRIGMPERLGGLPDFVANPAYATGVGLALYGRRINAGAPAAPRRGDRLKTGLVGLIRRWFGEFFAE
ncbi:MAG: cell division protein FtsA [Bacillota bacterium]|nr:cell division protein FtsA [Bacillota bacterium]